MKLHASCTFNFLGQGQNLVKFNCHFSLQAQYLVKFRMIAGGRDVVFFNTKSACFGESFFVAGEVFGDVETISLTFWNEIFRGRRYW